jgi:hypothetical protein
MPFTWQIVRAECEYVAFIFEERIYDYEKAAVSPGPYHLRVCGTR